MGEPDQSIYPDLMNLAETDTAAAIEEAQRIRRTSSDTGERASAAGFLVDVGSREGRRDLVRAGLATLRHLVRSEPARAGFRYQLGTAYLAVAALALGSPAEKREASHNDRVKERGAQQGCSHNLE
jgi:hypothetical protein